ncbi:MAG: ascorbate-dependent monooxygenase [Verrucomicrobiota bacterium]
MKRPTLIALATLVFASHTIATETTPTYSEHIAPILLTHCTECHRPGDIGPFPLLDYASAKRRAKTIARVVEEKFMPPWLAAPHFGRFVDERHLTDDQINLITTWAENGAPEGDPAKLPDLPEFADRGTWRLGPPDQIITMPEPFTVPASGEDIYQYFVIPKAITKNRDLVAVDFKPGDPSVVHHSIFYADHSGKATKEDAKNNEPGFSVFGQGGGFMESNNNAYAFGGWAPGAQPYQLPTGLGIPLFKGADIVMEIHYHLSGKPATDQSRIGLYFADKENPVTKYVDGTIMGTFDVDIPAGDSNYKRHLSMTLPAPMTLIDISPHMHYLATNVKAVATKPDGHTIPLIYIPRWDFRWQDIYVYEEPITLPKGTRIDVDFTYDNSAENPFNPVHPPERSKWGWKTNDEMCELYLTFTTENERDGRAIQRAANKTWQGSPPSWNGR